MLPASTFQIPDSAFSSHQFLVSYLAFSAFNQIKVSLMKLRHSPLPFALWLIIILLGPLPRVATADWTDQCPRFQFNPPDSFKDGMKFTFAAPGVPGPKADSFTSISSGFWRGPNGQSRQPWSIAVSRKVDPNIVAAYTAADAYAVDLAKSDSGGATPYLYARFQKFSFSWGNAVGYFVQTTSDASWREPNNAQLVYEIRGVTSDQQYTVVAKFSVTHPQLPLGNSSLLDAQGDVRKLSSFNSYKLLSKSAAESFQPSLADIQELVSSVSVLRLKRLQITGQKPQ
jgi:hypothetical protein